MPSAPKVQATFKLKGEDSLVRIASAGSLRARAAVRGVIATYALKVERKLKRKLSEGGSGRTYGNHQASAPGEAPATDTGRYKSSIRHELKAMAARVVTDVEYAAPLEFGTDDMQPRPMWRPVIREVTDDFYDDVLDALTQAL